MSLELLEKFILELAPPAAQIPIHNVFTQMKAEPIQVMGTGFHMLMPDIKAEGSLQSAAAVNGILLGICLCYGTQRSTDMAQMLHEYIEHNRKGKGENVVDFAAARIGKKL